MPGPLSINIDVPRTVEMLEAVAEALTAVNYIIMRTAADNGRVVPLLYETGTVYRREPPGREWWETVLDILAVGEGDCEDLSAYRAAELRYRYGEPARVHIYRTERGTYHAVVRRSDGTIEDPSRILVDKERGYAG